MRTKEYIGKNINIKIDRKLGSKHPKHGFIYPVNYGYVPNTISGDGEELDCYLLGVFEPVDEYTGKCIAVIHRINDDDDDDKLVISPDSREFSNSEIDALTEFQERFFEHEIIRSDVTFNSLIPELSVSNIEKSVEFYKKIGFKVIYERLENKFCFLELEHNQLMIEEINDNWNTAILEYPFGRGINISMSVLDIEKMYNNLKDKNIEIFKELECHTYKVNEVIYKDKEFLIQDPDGYLLRFNN